MESTSHLESPGVNLSGITDRRQMHFCDHIKNFLTNLFTETGKGLAMSQCRMTEEMRSMITKRFENVNAKTFPGAQPISMQRDHLSDTMAGSRYLCCEKTDGVRFLCVITQTRSLLIDRNYNIFDVKMERLNLDGFKFEFIHVFDGELIKDRGEDFTKFFIFDALVVNGKNIMNLTFENRLRTVKNKVIKKLRIQEYCEITCDRADNYDDDEDEFDKLGDIRDDSNGIIKIYLKDFFLDIQTKDLWEKVIPKLDHGNDGIIYTMNDCPYYPGTCSQIIKWKPAFLNSVDFNLKLITSYNDNEYIWGLYARTYEQPEFLYDCIFFENAEENEKWRKTIAQMSNHSEEKPVIVECAFNSDLDYDNLIRFNKYKRMSMKSSYPREDHLKRDFKFDSEVSFTEKKQLKGGWIIERQRTDKETPNSLRVAINIKATIMDPVSVDDIINCPEIRAKYCPAGMKRSAQAPPQSVAKRQKTE
ncbi:unnamed protein product [Moneuplotes crassus]|uniref:mRNA guanylyltransferase n=2 Tax=Euplotes crassus TaxID=5936 RepID=A0AAD1UL07_EUPCR|nr:unnamed protein product [Moneuplotes crassus]